MVNFFSKAFWSRNGPIAHQFSALGKDIKKASQSVYSNVIKPSYTHVIKPTYDKVLKPVGTAVGHEVTKIVDRADRTSDALVNTVQGTSNLVNNIANSSPATLLAYGGLILAGLYLYKKPA